MRRAEIEKDALVITTSQHFALDASVRSYDIDGRLKVARSHISRACVNEYLGSEIPGCEALGLDPDRIYNLLRAPTELKRAEATFNELPILLKHDETSAAEPKKDLVVGTTGSNATFDGDYLDNSLSIWDGEAIKLIETGTQKELSCGYRYKVEMKPGVFRPGESYDGVMRSIVGNHVALVEKGRAGPDVMVGDSAPARRKEPLMVRETNLTAAVSYLKSKLSDQDLAELVDILGQSGGTGDGSDQPTTMAMLAELDLARRETTPVLGGDAHDMALDSASKVYGAALRAMGIDIHGAYAARPLRTMFRMALSNKRRGVGPGSTGLVMDSARLITLMERYPHAAKIRGA